MTSPLRGWRVVDINCQGCLWREKLNAELVNQINILKAQLEFSKALIPIQRPPKIAEEITEDWEPLGTRKPPLRRRIATAERKIREDAIKEQQAVSTSPSSS